MRNLFVGLMIPKTLKVALLSLFAMLAALLSSYVISPLDNSQVVPLESELGPVEGLVRDQANLIELPEKALTKLTTIILELQAGQTLANLLKVYQLSSQEIYRVGRLLEPYIKPHRLQTGQKFVLNLSDQVLRSIELNWEFAKQLRLTRIDAEWKIEIIDLETRTEEKYASGVITSSLYESASAKGVPVEVINRFMAAYSHAVDFQREILPGDQYTILYTEKYLSDGGEVKKIDQLKYLELVSGGKKRVLLKYKGPANRNAFYDLEGNLADSFLMKTPVDGANLASYYGRRLHPILGYSRMHEGLDFSAPINTPVMAAGHGVIENIGTDGGYGKRITILHANGYQTLYAHLNGYVSGLTEGSEVEQGDVIGYLGNTGLSQGRHLHYEVHRMGKAINPLTIKQVGSVRLKGDDLAGFSEYKQTLLARLK